MTIIVICGAGGTQPVETPDGVGVALANALAEDGNKVFCLRGMVEPWLEVARVYLTFGFADAGELSRQLEELSRFEVIDAIVDVDQSCNLRQVRRFFPGTKVAAFLQGKHTASLPGIEQLKALLVRWMVGVPLSMADDFVGQGRA